MSKSKIKSMPICFFFFYRKGIIHTEFVPPQKMSQRTSFRSLENIKKSATGMLKTIPVEDFQHCYQKWEQRLHQCVAAQGNYFEGTLMFEKMKTLVNKNHYFSATPHKTNRSIHM